MKMNRTEWIIVILCASALIYLMTQRSPQPPKKPDAAETKPAATPATPETPATTPATPPVPAPEAVKPETIVLKNDAAEYTFTNIGGGMQEVKILPAQYAGQTPQILNGPQNRGAIGGLSKGPGDIEHLAYTASPHTDKAITYTAVTEGLKITKEWKLADGTPATDGYGYLWNLSITFTNTADAQQAGQFYLYSGLLGRLHDNDVIKPSLTWYADGNAEEMDESTFVHGGFLGMGKSADDKYIEKVLPEMAFAGVHNQYYAVLVNPAAIKKNSSTKLWSQRASDHGMEAGVGMDAFTLTKDQSYTWKGEVYTGPRSGTVLNRLGGERRQAMHYGWFRVLSRLFLGLLNTFYSWAGSYGIAIMMLTLLVRVCIWPLHIKATRAMKRMSKLAPMMKDIREKHKDNPQQMNVEVMKLYRDYGVNPLGGCLPLLFQFPIFLGYFNMMKNAVEMRGHHFLWVNDLSMPDTVAHLFGIPINPLPLLMTITMFVQMKVAPQPAMDANPQMQMQMKIFKVMPFLFMLFCYTYASALALYWTVQNIISIGQTWLMKRQGDPPLVKVPPRPSLMERAMAAQQARQQQNKGPRPPRPGGGAGSAFRDNQRKK